MIRSGRARQRGVALVMALVVVAISAIIASDLLYRTFIDQRRTESVLHSAQARQYLYGAEDWVGHLLRRDSEETEIDSLDQPWAEQLPPLPVDGGQITGRLEDQQGLFNLNNLITDDGRVNEMAHGHFQRLLALLEIDPEIADAVLDWIDADQEPRFPMGAEDGTYLGQDPAYRAANQGFQSVSELRLVAGFQDPEVYDRIEPYVTALPNSIPLTPINVNTAPAPVLAALVENLAIDQVEGVVGMQEAGGFESPQAFLEAIGQNLDVDPEAYIAVRTSFFRLTARADIGSASVTMYSLIYRNESGVAAPLNRSFGTY
ncbi:general secretion pathway protein K [Natronospira proteinivora]|uniref:Type II secretion system protein K n=1 Tax=Natronospira proteinivora TaxID=1807133 RepID=A0ABT1G6F9_9GAMM|nr:type II secretion system minor pseudopilin GspK [Natronospira proteinivora]MCP1726875.1 general secretion pathway protein K [Natronospira proteinivora]